MTDNRSEECVREESVVILESGHELRRWIERQAMLGRPSVIRYATFSATPLGIRWLGRLSGQGAAEVRVLCDVNQACANLAPSVAEAFPKNRGSIRLAPARLGPSAADSGLFHPKLIILDDGVAVVGSANLSGKALGIGPRPHNVEMSIGLSGGQTRGTIARLIQFFDQWWEQASPLPSKNKLDSGKESDTMVQPEYVVFRGRPNWGIAQVQTEGTGLFGQEQWLAVSDISPGNPERRVARVQVPDEFIESIQPEPWEPPAAQVSGGASSIEYTKEHFWRLAAYWLQAENRQGQLDSLPVLQLRHQTSLVEYLSRPDAPREVLIADEVGLGKTVELGLLLSRLRAGNPKLRILYVIPGGLVDRQSLITGYRLRNLMRASAVLKRH